MEEKDYRLSIGFPPELGKIIRKRAKENGRSFAKEIVQLVKAQLALKQQKGVVASDSNEADRI